MTTWTPSYLTVVAAGSMIGASDAGAIVGSVLNTTGRFLFHTILSPEDNANNNIIEAAATLVAAPGLAVGWFQLVTTTRQHGDHRPAIFDVWLTDTAGGNRKNVPWTPLQFAPDATGFVTHNQARIAETVDGQTLPDVAAEYATNLKLWVRFARGDRDQDEYGYGGAGFSVPAIAIALARIEFLPTPQATVAWDGAAGKLTAAQLDYNAIPRTLLATFTDADGEVDQVLRAYGPPLEVSPGLLHPVIPSTTWVAEVGFDSFIGHDITYTDTDTVPVSVAGNTWPLTATVADYRVALRHAVGVANLRAFERQTEAGWERVAHTDPTVYVFEDFRLTVAGDITDNNLAVDELGLGWASAFGPWTYTAVGSGIEVNSTSSAWATVQTDGREDVEVGVAMTIKRGTADVQWEGFVLRSIDGDWDPGLRAKFNGTAAAPDFRLFNGTTATLKTWNLAALMVAPPIDGDRVEVVMRCEGNDITLVSIGVNGAAPEIIEDTYTLTGADATAVGAGSGADRWGLYNDERTVGPAEFFEWFRVAAIAPPVYDYPPLNTEHTYRAWHGANPYTLVNFQTLTPVTVAADGWVLTRLAAEAVSVLLAADAVEAEREIPNRVAHNGTAGVAVYGEPGAWRWTVTATAQTVAERVALEAVLFGQDPLLFRGPHGEHHRVVVVDEVTVARRQALTSPAGISAGLGAEAETAHIVEFDFTLEAL